MLRDWESCLTPYYVYFLSVTHAASAGIVPIKVCQAARLAREFDPCLVSVSYKIPEHV